VNEPEAETRLSDDAAPGELTRWGIFEDLQRVGSGSFGEVYRAFEPTLQRYVALKLLLPNRISRNEEMNALLREARALARVRHPNVVPIYGVDRYEGRLGFWSDFVKGQTLADLVATRGALGPQEAALIGADVCRAAGAVHAAGLLHRDIKAGNVMREEGGRILLMDFGLTHEHGSGADGSGTPVYMAPEVMAGYPATIASDIYAIGVMLFYLMTKRYPVEGGNFSELRAAHAAGKRHMLLDLRPDLPDSLARVVETAINSVPEKRFATTGQMIVALSEAIGVATATGHATPPPRRRGLHPWMLIPAVAAAALIFGVRQWRPTSSSAVAPPGVP
jgi:serine/threonine protein kinase